ncbi:GNAT family N-acetyltransferase [Nocardioides ferulae]|uniref:GNAT family N-acetyltransferase n=1 Tax=Nocardioides ferulae TaxID=2340821 RepID=UPI000EB2053E|nr:GNAT family N-acetyltransferase [Nocardioides ferulae]
MDEVAFRAAGSADVDEVVDFWSRAAENGARPVDRPELVRRLVEHEPEALMLATLNGRIVGTIVAGWDGWRANLYRLAVEPELRGRGLGRRLLAGAEERLRALGAERYCAMVLDENELGRSLWESTGYTRQGEWRRWVKPVLEDGGPPDKGGLGG